MLRHRAVEEARSRAPEGSSLLQGDLRDLGSVPDTFDAVTILWRSFGYFGDEMDAAVLRNVHAELRPGGRLVLDVYHCGFLERRQGRQTFGRGGLTATEHKRMDGPRLRVDLNDGDGHPGDTFDWRPYTPEELRALARSQGLACLLTCTGFDEEQPASADVPRMQLVFACEDEGGVPALPPDASPGK